MLNDAVADRTISFDAPTDLSECPGRTCPENHGYTHKHCASCAGILLAFGGGGDDGSKVDGYCDGDDYQHEAVKCVECGESVHRACVTRAGDDRPLCSRCCTEVEAKVEEANLVVNDMLDAARDLKTAGQRLARETDPQTIAAAVAALREVQIEASFCASVVAVVRVRAAA